MRAWVKCVVSTGRAVHASRTRWPRVVMVRRSPAHQERKSSISSNSALPMLHGSVYTRARRLDASPRGGQEIPSRVTLSLKKGWYIFNWSLQGHVGGSLELIDRNPCRPCQVTKIARGDVANGANQQPSGTPVLTTYQPDTNAKIF